MHLTIRYGVLVHADGVVPAEEDNYCHEGIPGQLDDDIRHHEDFPRVRLRRTFADFVQGPLHDEVRHGLLYDVTEDGHKHEDGEELILEALQTGRGSPEGEANEE